VGLRLSVLNLNISAESSSPPPIIVKNGIKSNLKTNATSNTTNSGTNHLIEMDRLTVKLYISDEIKFNSQLLEQNKKDLKKIKIFESKIFDAQGCNELNRKVIVSKGSRNNQSKSKNNNSTNIIKNINDFTNIDINMNASRKFSQQVEEEEEEGDELLRAEGI
jgi:hypothetical protein